MASNRSPMSRSARIAAGVLLGLLSCVAFYDLASAQQASLKRLPITNEDWQRPFPGFRVVGNLYYVGSYDLGVYLITTPAGHILINTGAYDSVQMIKASIESLGFAFEDIEILLTTQAHWDHVADLAAIKRLTGARMFAHARDAAVLEDGGNSDFRFPDGRGVVFEPIAVDRRLQDGDTVELGGTVLTLHHHPGHTKGASSFTFTARDEGQPYSVLIVNMGSINNGVELLNMPAYPEIADDYAATFAAQKAMAAEVWVSSHSSHFDLHDKFKPGDAYEPTRFIDPAGYAAKIDLYEQRFLAQLAEERARRPQ